MSRGHRPIHYSTRNRAFAPLISAPATAPLITPADAGALNAELLGEPDSRFRLLGRLLRRTGFYHHRAAQAMEALIHNLNTMNSRAGAQEFIVFRL